MELRMIHVASCLQRGVGHPHLATLGEPAGLALLPVGGGHLTALGLRDGPAGEGLELVAHQGPPEEGPAGEAGSGGVETVPELGTTIRIREEY